MFWRWEHADEVVGEAEALLGAGVRDEDRPGWQERGLAKPPHGSMGSAANTRASEHACDIMVLIKN